MSAPPPRPRWVKLAALAAAVVIAVLVIAVVTGGDHGPSRHDGSGGHTMPSGVPEHGAPSP